MTDVEDLLNLIRREVERSIARIARPRGGLVTQYDPNRHAVQVQWPEDVADDGSVQQSPWIPIKVASLGNGWGLAHGPAIGSQALVDFLDGNPNTPFVSGFLPSLAEVAPAAPSGETWLLHQSGSLLKLTNDGKVAISGHTDVNVTATGTLNATAAVINLNP